MVGDPNKWAVRAIIASVVFASGFAATKSIVETNISFEDSTAGLQEQILDTSNAEDDDRDGDGLVDRLEEKLGTDPDNPDTDGDGLSDSAEYFSGLDPLDGGTAGNTTGDGTNIDDNAGFTGDQNETSPDPNNGADGDPDKDGLTNSQEVANRTDPMRADTDGDGLSDGWEARMNVTVYVNSQGEVSSTSQEGFAALRLFDPLDGNWDCPLLTEVTISELKNLIGETNWTNLGDDSEPPRYSCDQVLDRDGDNLPNYVEEDFGTNPENSDSDGDGLTDTAEIATGEITVSINCGSGVKEYTRKAPFSDEINQDRNWLSQDDDLDGSRNGPSDYDSDQDGMPDGYEFCFSVPRNGLEPLDASDPSDSYGDPDEDGLTSFEEYGFIRETCPDILESAHLDREIEIWEMRNPNKLWSDQYPKPWSQLAEFVLPDWAASFTFTDPMDGDSDDDAMPDGWESKNCIDPLDPTNSDKDPDRDGFDRDNNGQVRFTELDYAARVKTILVEIGDDVEAGDVIAVAEVIDVTTTRYDVLSPCTGKVYEIHVEQGQEIFSRQTVWAEVVEADEMYTNLDEYESRFDNPEDLEGRREVADSTNPTHPDTDRDGLKDGIEVLGWEIRIVTATKGSIIVPVTSDPTQIDTDNDGLNDVDEYSEYFTNASNNDTDSDGLSDWLEQVQGFMWTGIGEQGKYFTNASMFDTDNDQLEDGEEVNRKRDNTITHANRSDTDSDGLKDGYEILFLPRPFQDPTDPLNNDTDSDGMLDGWEMQIESVQDNTKSHSLWISTIPWRPEDCPIDNTTCLKNPGGFLWRNPIGKWAKIYEIEQMNLDGVLTAGITAKWAINPASSIPDTTTDVDDDGLNNTQEGPTNNGWNTNPVQNDTDGDGLPDGWEVEASENATILGLVDAEVLSQTGARGLLDPRMPDSDLDNIPDGEEDPDGDGMDRAILLRRYCPDAGCHIDPTTPDGKRFYDDLANFTNYEEWSNGTSPVTNDTDGDSWEDGSEVYYMDQDGDGMASGWEYYFGFDPFDDYDRNDDPDMDSFENWCEYKWNTNPKDIQSQPGPFQLCNTDD